MASRVGVFLEVVRVQSEEVTTHDPWLLSASLNSSLRPATSVPFPRTGRLLPYLVRFAVFGQRMAADSGHHVGVDRRRRKKAGEWRGKSVSPTRIELVTSR